MFGKIVNEWLDAQPQDYQTQYDSIFDIGPWAGSTRTKFVDMFV